MAALDATFVARDSCDGQDEETFCLSGVHVTAGEVYAMTLKDMGKWERRKEKPCDGSCRSLSLADALALFEKKVETALPTEVQEGFWTVFARPASSTAKVFETWYVKRGGEGIKACLGDVHVEFDMECREGIIQDYVKARFRVRPCDGSCRPLCLQIPEPKPE